MRLLILAFLLPLFVVAQDGGSGPKVQKYPKAKTGKKYRIAKAQLKNGSYYNAADYLEDVVEAKPDKIKRVNQLADLNRYLRDYKKAEQYYKMVLDKDAGKFPDANFYYAQMLKANGKYTEAKTKFQEFAKSKDAADYPALKSATKAEIAGCDTALALIAAPTKIKVVHENETINNPLQDFSPKPLSNNRLMYSALKSDTAINIDLAKNDYFTSVFITEKKGGTWSEPTALPSPPNDSKTHVGNAVYNKDETQLVFTKCDQSQLSIMICKLYRSKKEGSGWGEPEELKNLNRLDMSTTHPSFGKTKDGKTILYFSSNRGNGGDYDIYYSNMTGDGSFEVPQRLGNEVNTAGDELTPSYNEATSTLYFASTGHPGLGGLDVFKVSGTPGNFGAVSNLGVPINSGADDLYFALDEKAAKGFMVSNREGTTSQRGSTCCDDIFSVIIKNEIFLKGTFVKRDDPTQTPIDGVDASLYKVDGKNFELQTNALTTGGPFIMPLKRGTSYKMNGTKDNFWPSIDNFTVSEDEEKDTIVKVFYIDPVLKKKIKIENVYFQFDKSNVIAFYSVKIDSVLSLLALNPGWIVEVQGHTDTKGTDEYNDKLAVRRAEEVKKYLIKMKLAKERIVVKTFGEKQPAVANELPDGADDPEGRARNRRVEFRIIVDRPDDAPEFEYSGEVVPQVKTGPGFTTPNKKK